ncbi:hypothetical protein SLA2020_278450 [Shorea laevis]
MSVVLRRRSRTLGRRLYSSKSSSSSTRVPILYKPESDDSDAVTLQLLSWGRGASGQLGGGIEENRLAPPGHTPRPFLDDKEGAVVEVGVSCGLFHSSLLVDGKLWIWGKGDGGRLGFGHENPAFVPTLNPHLDSVHSVALGGLHSVALSSAGEVFTWGYGGFGALGHSVYHRELFPRLVEGSWSGKIRHIATSGTHTAAITESGELYTWGRDEGDGRLGLGPERGPNEGGGLSIPSKVKELPMPVTAVSCGGFWTMVLTEQGQLWNWGANSNYELGRGDRVGGWKPKPIPSLEDVRVIQIASGGYHSLALTDDGKVLSWGHGGHAAVTDKGKLYMWGNSKDSQLGVPGLPEVQPCPIEVNFLIEDDGLGPHNVISVAVGASHATCLVMRSGC